MLEGYAFGNVNGERNVENAMSDTLQKVRYIEAFNIQVGMN